MRLWAERGRAATRRLGTALSNDSPGPLEIVLGPDRYLPTLLRAEGLWVVSVAAVGLVGLALPTPDLPGLQAGAVAVLLGLVVLAGSWLVLRADHVSVRTGNLLVAVAIAGIPLIVHLLGPSLQVSTAVVVAAGISNFVFQRRRMAILSSVALAVGYALVLATQDGYAAPVQRWLVVVASMTASSVSLAWLVGIVEALAVQERDGRIQLDAAHGELASLNEQMAHRIDAQVEEIGALNRLRRFLSPQVAEAVLQGGEASLAPHRQQIAVLFCELRGFTGFANEAAPEDVIEVLDAWFASLGELLDRYEANVGTVAGDGLMVYFGDPLPHPDPAGAAVKMAVDMRRPMEQLVGAWKRRGYSLGYGISIAYGFATMGTIGFESRSEYTPLGNVVNLASRLCESTGDGDILIDDRTHVAVADRVVSEERLLQLRGYREPIPAHHIVAWRTADPPSGAGDPDGDDTVPAAQTSGQG